MTPRAKLSLQTIGVLVAAVVGVAGMVAPLSRAMARDVVIAHGESTFVRRDTFALYLERQHSDRRQDSTVRANERIADALRLLVIEAKLDTVMHCQRHPDVCRRDR